MSDGIRPMEHYALGWFRGPLLQKKSLENRLHTMHKKPLLKSARYLLVPTRPTKKLTPRQRRVLNHLIFWRMTRSKTYGQSVPSDERTSFYQWRAQKYNQLPRTASKHIKRVQQNEKKESDYFARFSTRQIIRQVYGHLKTHQMTTILRRARNMKGHAGKNFMGLLESRLDIALLRIGFCGSIGTARQLINHGKVRVNSERSTYPGFCLSPGDMITMDPSSHSTVKATMGIHSNDEQEQDIHIHKPVHMEVNYKLLTAIFLYRPTHVYLPIPKTRDDIIRSFAM